MVTLMSTLNPPKQLTVAYLGPAGTHSHLFALDLFGRVDQTGFRYQAEKDLTDVLQAVLSGRAGWGLVPYFNSQSGPVGKVYPALLDVERGLFAGLEIFACISSPIYQDLLGTGSLKEIQEIYSKKEAYEQCKDTLRQLLPKHKEKPDAPSTSDAARQAEKRGSQMAAIASRKILQFHPKLKLLKAAVNDAQRNITQFLVFRRSEEKRTIKNIELEQQTWISFSSSVDDSILQKMLSLAQRWGIKAAALSGAVVEPDKFKMRFLMELARPLDSLKVSFFLNETKHLSPIIVGSPLMAKADNPKQMEILKRGIIDEVRNSKPHNESDSYAWEHLEHNVQNALARIPAQAYKLYVHSQVSTMESVWEVLGIPPESMLNTQVCENSSKTTYAFCCVAGNKKIDESKISRLLEDEYKRMRPRDLRAIGQRRYAVSPLTAPENAVIVIDEMVKENDFLFLGSGKREISIALNLRQANWPQEVVYGDIKIDI